MTFYRRPTKLTQAFNRFFSWLSSLGLTPSRTVTLEVRGRRSGQIRSAVVNWVEQDGERYLVSPRGESEWVRNVRAAGGEAVVRRRQRHFGVDPKADLTEFEAIAARHPVFRIVNTTEGEPEGQAQA